MDRWVGKVAMVTGGSAGIGAQITWALARNGMRVITVARRLDKLEELTASIKSECEAEVYPKACDVTKEEDILEVFKWAEANLGGVDVMINNAAVLVLKPIIEGSTKDYRKIMDVNVIATAICSRELVQSVKKRKTSGHIININSILGHNAESICVPINLYPASKYAVTGMCYSMRNELEAAKIDVKITSISPGAVETDMLRSISAEEQIMKIVVKLMPDDIANAVVFALSQPPQSQICEMIIKPHQTLTP